MTEQEQNLAIAKACGWKVGLGHPNYVRDLNGMHEAEKILDVNSLSRYADELDKVCVPTHICPLTHWQSVTMASAAQRAEAFLRTIGKWKE